MKHLYIIKSGPYHKIGITNNLIGRLSSINTSSPHGAKLVDSIETKHPRIVEAYIHGMFSDYRVHGEWFDLDKTQLIKTSLIMRAFAFNASEISESFDEEQISEIIFKVLGKNEG